MEEIIRRGKYNAFRDEAEQLREKGEWKQLELFSRGRHSWSNFNPNVFKPILAVFYF